MLEYKDKKVSNIYHQVARHAASLSLLFLLIEFFDELTYAIDGAALPWIRAELGLTYAQIGLMLGLPGFMSTLIEPAILLLGDTNLRKRLVVSGGLVMALSLAIIAASHGFPALLLAFVMSYPASGAFVTLSQATLMDLNRGRETHMMARWTVAGSLGNLIGPFLLAIGFAVSLGWRWAYACLGAFGLALALRCLTRPFPSRLAANHNPPDLRKLLHDLWHTARNRKLLRWLGLLEMSDLMMDVFTSYLALYFSDVAGASPTQTSLILGASMVASLASDIAVIPLLERISDRTLIRISSGVTAVLFVGLLLSPWMAVKIILLLLVRLFTLGWYPILQGEAYASVPGKSGTVMAMNSIAGILGSIFISMIGLIANRLGLATAMWFLLLGPVSLLLFVPSSSELIKESHPGFQTDDQSS
jgi:FSR family fosmidomycin resistance protein-like MFS transporter